MRTHLVSAQATVVTLLALLTTPMFADQRERVARGGDRGRSDRGETQGHGTERARPHGDAAPPSEARPQAVAPRAVPRPEVVAPRIERPRGERPVIVAPRVERPWGYQPRDEPRYTPHYAPRGYGDRPYVFRPRLHLNFGIWLGYPVPYAYTYPVPVYGYAAPRESVVVGPGSNVYGGVALEITPEDGFVYVDGNYAGLVRDFDGTDQPLTLAGGMHRIEVQAPGYEPMTIDVTVQPGQVIPYRGDLRRW